MDYIIWMIIGFFFIIGGAIFILIKYVDSRFPKIMITTKKKGTTGRRNYRTMGDIIVQDDIMSLLMGNFLICGFKSWLDYSLDSGKRVYEGYLCRDFVLSVSEKITDVKPSIEIDGTIKGNTLTIKAKLADELLLPIKYSNLNYEIIGNDLQKGREIAGKFVTSLRQNQEYTNSTNPFLMMLIAVLPQLLMMGIMFAGMYFILQLVFDRVDTILDVTAQLGVIAKNTTG